MSQVEAAEQFTSVGLDGKISIHTRYEPPEQFKIKCSMCTELLTVYPSASVCNEYKEYRVMKCTDLTTPALTLRLCPTCEYKLTSAACHTPYDVNKSVKFD